MPTNPEIAKDLTVAALAAKALSVHQAESADGDKAGTIIGKAYLAILKAVNEGSQPK